MGNALEQCCAGDDDTTVLMQKIYEERKGIGKKKRGIMTNALEGFKLDPVEKFEKLSEYSREDEERDYMHQIRNKDSFKQRRNSIDSINSFSTDIHRVEQSVSFQNLSCRI